MEINHALLLQTFLTETEENLTGMEEALVELETRPEDDEALGVIFRAAHTLKGDSASFGFHRVGEFAHAMENVLDSVRSGAMPVTSEVITALLRCIDVLREMIPMDVRGEARPIPEAQALLGRLGALLEASAGQHGEGPTGHRAVGGAPANAHAPGAKSHLKTLRVDTDKLDRMLNLITEITVGRGRLGQMLEVESAKGLGHLLDVHRSDDGLYRDLQELIMKARMVPIEATFQSYSRVVRDLANTSGKLARLVVDAQGVEVDTRIIEHLRDPLTHMVRNAVDHGIESPDERIAQGKEPCGLITLRARYEAGYILVQVIDDGAGMNRARIVERAVAMGIAADPARMADADLYRLVLEPGFSTAESVSQISGRGIGMDVVRRNINAVRGSLHIESTPGRGTAVAIRLPLTLAIIDGFSVGVGEETYVIPTGAIVECVELPPDARGKDETRGVINLRGHALPYIHLRSLLSVGGTGEARGSLVVVQYEGGRAGLAVDSLYGESQTVIKPLGKLLEGVSGISGSAILGDGRVALILDIPSLFKTVLSSRDNATRRPS